MDIAVNPALIIALGGTGQNVVNRFRRRLRQRIGTDSLPLVEYLYVDTDRGNKDALEDTGDGIPIGLSPQVAAELADLQGRAAMEMDLASWISEDALDRLRRGTLGGAQGFRQLGHVSFLASARLRELNSQLKERVGNLLEARRELVHHYLPRLDPPYLRVRLQGAGPKVFIYVIASAGGGTGSSTLIDLGYFLRRALREAGYELDCRTLGLALLASSQFGEEHQYRYNSGGVLCELNHWLRRPAYRAAYPVAFPGDPLRPDLPAGDRLAGIATALPYDYHYVVQPATLHGGLLDPDDPPRGMGLLEQRVAELILSDTVFAAPPGAMEYDSTTSPPTPPVVVQRVLKGELESRRVDFAGRTRGVLYDAQYPSDLLTFGVTCREFPAAMHHVLAFGRAVRSLAERWAATPRPEPGAPADDLGHPLANARLADWLDRLCLLREESRYEEQRSRPAETDQLLAALLAVEDLDIRQQLAAVALQATEGQRIDPEQWLIGRRGALDQLSQPVADCPPPGAPGSVHARLRDRRQALAGWTAPGLPHELCRALLDLAFDADAGAGAALALAERLERRVARELEYVRLCRAETPPPRPVGRPATPPVKDWLLFGWENRLGGPVDLSAVRAAAWDHADRRLFEAILEGKEAVLSGCLTALQRLRPRLANLRDYFRAWQAEAPDPDDPAYQLTADEQQFVLREPDLIEQFARLDGLAEKLRGSLQQVTLYRDLLADVARGLPATDDRGDPALLVSGPPLDRRRNQPDFGPLEEIEAALFEAIGARRDGPYQQEVIDLLERRAAAAGTEFPDLQAEASPLLMFDANNTGYPLDCQFGGDVELWQLHSAHNSLNHHHFDTALSRRQAGFRFSDTPDTKMIRVDTLIPSVVTLTRHRAGVVTPLINGYSPDAIRRMLRNAAHTPLTDIRIRPPLDPNLLWQAGYLYLGGLLLGPGAIFAVDGDRFLFAYADRDAAGFTRTRQVRLPLDFTAACERLAVSDIEREQLDAQVRLKVFELQDGVVSRLEEVIGQIDRHRNEGTADFHGRRFDVWAAGGQASGVFVSELDYEDALNLLTSFAQEFGLRCQVEFKHAYADHKHAGEPIVGGAAQVDGWYCRYCGAFHGGSVPANNRTCGRCRNRPVGAG